VLQPDGRILAVGNPATGPSAFALARYIATTPLELLTFKVE